MSALSATSHSLILPSECPLAIMLTDSDGMASPLSAVTEPILAEGPGKGNEVQLPASSDQSLNCPPSSPVTIASSRIKATLVMSCRCPCSAAAMPCCFGLYNEIKSNRQERGIQRHATRPDEDQRKRQQNLFAAGRQSIQRIYDTLQTHRGYLSSSLTAFWTILKRMGARCKHFLEKNKSGQGHALQLSSTSADCFVNV